MTLKRFVVTSRDPFVAADQLVGSASYELIRGVADFAVDPEAAENARIVDLRRAQRSDGLVRFSSDVCLLVPSQSHNNGRLLSVVPNRGVVSSLPFSSGAATTWGEASGLAVGDAFLLRRGWTIAWCGWQWDVRQGSRSLGFAAPDAIDNGAPITGQTRVEIWSDAARIDHPLADSPTTFAFHVYPAADCDDAEGVLTVRDWRDGPRTVIDRDRWRFARVVDGVVTPDDSHLWLEGGLEPFRWYELVYRTSRSPVVGAGMLAVRDFNSFLRWGSVEDGNPCAGSIDVAIAHGASQSARLLRQYLYEGLNVDEAGQKVFDGVFALIGGSRRGEFNHRFAQPSLTQTPGFGDLAPYATTSANRGLLARLRTSDSVPKIFSVNTSWEYWRGDAALGHIDPESLADIEDPDVRCYMLAGIDHAGAASLAGPWRSALPIGNEPNDLEAVLPLRALLLRLEQWIVSGAAPPNSAVPTLADGSAITRAEAVEAFPAIPGARLPAVEFLAFLNELDLGPNADVGVGSWPPIVGRALPDWVAALDEDGNERVGIRVPELAVPLGTRTGWNVRRDVPGLPPVLFESIGSWFPFARTAKERADTGDPRLSIEERYLDRRDYGAEVEAVVDGLVERGFLLAEDVDAAVGQALARWDSPEP